MESHASSDVPMFLRKTYQMINGCDPDIASWSEDGETFTVKNPDQFEKTVIPQFFKHSKFSSFVRQLNFYGFRKVKYTDSVKIETETANFWRFKHESFVRGKPELLKNIRRSQSQSHTAVEKTSAPVLVPKKVVEDAEAGLRSEVDVLKDRIAQMSSNLDQLTAMVNKITISDDTAVTAGSKRRLVKVEDVCSLSDQKPSHVSVSPMLVAIDDEMDDMDYVPDEIFSSFPVPLSHPSLQAIGSNPLSRQTSLAYEADNFVDELIASFGDESMEVFPEPVLSMNPTAHFPYDDSENEILENKLLSHSSEHLNAPDPALISRLSEALTILPRDMQELLVNRLIATITSHDSLLNHLDTVYKNSSDSCKNQERKSNPCVSIPMMPIHA